MTHQSPSAVLRFAIVLAAGLLAVWSLPMGGQLTFAGVVLAVTAVCGFLSRRGRLAWYALGAGLVVACLFLGTKDGPFDVATTGYCDSVFEPGYTVVEDAPRRTYARCEATRRARIPVVAGLALAGVAALVASSRPRKVDREHLNAP